MKKITFIIVCCLVTFLFSCEKTEKVKEFPAHKSKLVANCIFSNDSCFTFNLSKSLSPIDNAPFRNMGNSSAYIRVYENNVLFDSFRYNSVNENYSGNPLKIPKPGNIYKFDSYYPGFPALSAEDYIPYKPIVLDKKITTNISRTYYENDSLIACEFSVGLTINLDKSNSAKYLMITFGIPKIAGHGIYGSNGVYEFEDNNRVNDFLFANNILFVKNENGIENLRLQWKPEGERILFKNKSYFFKNIIITACSYNYYEYRRRLALQNINELDPFAEPTPISNNINNGYGIFGGFNSTNFDFDY